MNNTSKSVRISEYLKNNHKNVNNTKKLHYGVGVNDADYVTDTSINKVRISCPCYKAWVRMLERVYSNKWHEKYKNYTNVVVCDEWLYFSNFRVWWIDNYIDGYQLDKDIFSGDNKLYSPNTCVYVPQWLNKFIISTESNRGEHKIGSHWHEKTQKYRPTVNHPIRCVREFLGAFEDEELAHNAWLKRKLGIALELKPEMDKINLRIHPNVVEIIKNMK